jgi:ABC-type glycerol-3-phosphate transport system permease component
MRSAKSLACLHGELRLEICIQDGQEHHAQISDRFGGRPFEFPGRTLLRVLLVIPWAISTVVSAITWRLIYAPDFGVLNALLQQVGLIDESRSWLEDPLLARASIATTALFALLMAWDEFFYALLFTSNAAAKTVTVAIVDFTSGRISDYGLVAAAGVVAALPPVAIGFLLQKNLISGLMAGGVKG